MPLSITTEHREHNPGLEGELKDHEIHAIARARAQEAWLAAGGPADGFAPWWDRTTGFLGFDSLKALVGLAWQDGAIAGSRPMVDHEFHAWWDSISGQNTLAMHAPHLAKSKE